MSIKNNTDYMFSQDHQEIINKCAGNWGVDTIYTQQRSESVFNFYRDESFERYLFSFDLKTEDIIDMKPITVEGLDTIYVTGLMEDMKRIAPVLKSIGFTQIKDRPNAYQFETGINAPAGYLFDDDLKITYLGMPISEETAKKISEALIEEVLKIIGSAKKMYKAIGSFTTTEGRGTTEMIEGVWDSLQKPHDGYEILSEYLEEEKLNESDRWFDIETDGNNYFATTGTVDLDCYVEVKPI